MTDAWSASALGELVDEVTDRVVDPGSHDIAYVGLEHIEPGILRLGKVGHSSEVGSAKTLFRPGDVLFGKLRPYLHKVALSDRPGVCSTDILVLRAKEHLVLPEYLVLLASSESLTAHAVATSKGTRMPRTTYKSLAEFEVEVPPLLEQRRIVDLVSAFDRFITEAAVCRSRSSLLLRSHQEQFVAGTHPTATLGELAELRSGAGWKREQESPIPSPGAIPVIGITNTRADGRLVLQDRTYVRGLPHSVHLLDAHSIVAIRTNGNRKRIGNVYRTNSDVEGHAFSAFQIALRAHRPRERDYIFRVLGSPSVQASITQAASGSTGLGNIAITWLKALEIPWPDEQERLAFAETCEAAEVVANAYRHAMEEARVLRIALAERLLAGVVALPASYDRLLEAV